MRAFLIEPWSFRLMCTFDPVSGHRKYHIFINFRALSAGEAHLQPKTFSEMYAPHMH